MKRESGTICRLCESMGPHETFSASEMLYNTMQRFEYFECNFCKTVQILEFLPPDTISSFYPDNYYSFGIGEGSWLKRKLIKERDLSLLEESHIIGSVLRCLKPSSEMSLVARLKLKKEARILDVGCGTGWFLNRLKRAGFRNVFGADPFVEKSFKSSEGVPIEKAELNDVKGQFDLIMFNHSLEHMPDPKGTLYCAREKLGPNGICLVRIPTVSSVAWLEYRECWFQLDAPRHLVLPSRKGMKIAAEKAGFNLVDTVDDSAGFQFEYSENYRAGIAIHGGKPLLQFSRKQKREFEKRAREVNSKGLGDQVGFVLRAV